MKKTKIKEENLKQFSVLEVVIITSLTALVFMFVGAFILYKRFDNRIVYKEKFNELKDVYDAYNNLKKEYNGTVDKEKLIDGALKGMGESLEDKHTYYIPKDRAGSVNEKLYSSFQGLGINVVTTNNFLEVISVFEDSPAQRSEVLPGDMIYKIDNLNADEKSLNEITSYIKSSNKGEIKKLYILRNNEEIVIDTVIDEVEIPTVSSYLTDKNSTTVGVIKIDYFAGNTPLQFRKAYEKIASDTNHLVVDLRNNSGGYLSSASSIAGYFLEMDKVIYSVKTKDKEEVIKNIKDSFIDKKVVLLVNENTASAAEMFAGALKDNLDVKVVGINTYGKGFVQKVLNLENGGLFKFSVREIFTPNKNKIESNGIKVDYSVSLKDSDNIDFQLDKALTEVLR